MKKIKKVPKLKGEIPFIYTRNTIYKMGVAINLLVDALNNLIDVVAEQEKELNKIKKTEVTE